MSIFRVYALLAKYRKNLLCTLNVPDYFPRYFLWKREVSVTLKLAHLFLYGYDLQFICFDISKKYMWIEQKPLFP